MLTKGLHGPVKVAPPRGELDFRVYIDSIPSIQTDIRTRELYQLDHDWSKRCIRRRLRGDDLPPAKPRSDQLEGMSACRGEIRQEHDRPVSESPKDKPEGHGGERTRRQAAARSVRATAGEFQSGRYDHRGE